MHPRILCLPLTCLFAAAPLASEDAPAPGTTFDEHVTPILREKCASCHNPDKERGGLSVTTYARLMEGGSSGAVVAPGDPDGSRLYALITHKEEPFMPPKADKLAPEALETIRKWIAAGAPENAGSRPKLPSSKSTALAFAGSSTGRPEGPPPMPETVGLAVLEREARPGPALALASSPWAPLLAVGGEKRVLLYHSESLELLGVLPFPEGVPRVVRFSRNGAMVLAAGGRGARSGRCVIWNVKTGERAAEVGDELDSVLAADASPDLSLAAVGGSSRVVRILTTSDGKVAHEIRKHTDWILALEFSPDGVLLATADRAGGVSVWESDSGREYLTLAGHDAAVTALSWRADANLLATACEDGTVRTFEMEGGSQVKRWPAHAGGTLGVAFAPDGRLVTCGRDRVAKLWDGAGALQREFEPLGDIATSATASHDLSRVFAGDLQGEIRVWSTADGARLGALSPVPPTIESLLAAAQANAEAKSAAEGESGKAVEAARGEEAKARAALEAATQAEKAAAEAHEKAKAAAAAAQARLEKVRAAKPAGGT